MKTNHTGSGSNEGWGAPSIEELQALLTGYRVIAILGQGGMGAVYKARQRSLGRTVAIKILPPPPEDDEFHSAQRFENEARTMARMNHPGIVAIHDFGQTANGKFFYFVMEFVDGTDLAQAIRGSSALSQENSLAIVQDVCEALDYAHRHGVVHRDIKPGNILLSSDGLAKVADFGLARLIDPSQAQRSALTRSNLAMGTPDYAAPEILLPGNEADSRADLYSLGVMLYQMLTGEVPRGLFKMPSQKCLGIDSRFDSIICKAMEPDREDRYQTAQDINRALAEINRVPTRPEAPPAESDRAPRRKWGLLGAITVAVAISFGGFLRSHESDDRHQLPSPAVVLDQPWTDLLAVLGANPPGLQSEWSVVNGELLTPVAALVSHQAIEIPLASPPSDYDLRVGFTRHSGSAAIMVAFRHGDAGGFLYLDSFSGQGINYTASLSRITGERSGSGSTNAGVFIRPGSRHEVVLQVRAEKVRATLDGEIIADWNADWNRIAQDQGAGEGAFLPPGSVDHPIIGVGACSSEVTFHDVEIRALDGSEIDTELAPRLVGEVGAPVKSQRAKIQLSDEGWIDLLKGLDVAAQSLMAPWRLENDELRTPVANISHQTIEFPVAELPKDYDLRLSLTRHSGNAAITIGFVREGVGGCVIIDGMDNQAIRYKAELHSIPELSTYRDSMFLGEGERHVLVLQVRGESIRLAYDNEVIIDWSADWSGIRQVDGYFFPASFNRSILGFGACATDVTVHRAEIRAAESSSSPAIDQ